MAANDHRRLLVDVVIPARNCAPTLGPVLGALPARHVRSTVVVDNASSDSTAQVARDAGAIVIRESEIGYGASCRRAVSHLESLPQQPDAVVFVSGRGTDDPAELPRLLEPICRDNAELVIGVRHSAQGDLRTRRTKLAIRLIDILYRHEFDDLGPYRAVRFPALVALGLSDRGDGWNVEMQVKAVKLGLHIAQVPVAFRAATGRHSSPFEDARRSISRTGRVLFQIFRHATAR